MAVPTFTTSGAKATTPAKLDKVVFDAEIKNHDLLKQSYLAYLGNGRENIAKTKTRGQVRGSTIKPWRQKGTGRARFGSRYNPIWRGGGIVFGPTGNENYSIKLNTKSKHMALRQALTTLASQNAISVIDDIVVKSGKTTDLHKLLKKIDAKKNILLVVEHKTPEIVRASNNLSNVSVVNPRYLTVFSLLNNDSVVFTGPALKDTTAWLSLKADAKPKVAEEVK